MLQQGKDSLLSQSTVEMIPYAKQNKGKKHILTMINCFTTYVNVIPLKAKSGAEIIKAIAPILKSNKMI